MPDLSKVSRYEDMSPLGKLELYRQPDGDIIVIVSPDPTEAEKNDWPPFGLTAEFCTVGPGGGQSPNTRKALFNLWKAIELDNQQHPQHRG